MDRLDSNEKDGSVTEKFIERPMSDDSDADTSKASHKAQHKELSVVHHEKNWKAILIAVIVIAIVCTIVGLSAYFLQPAKLPTSYLYKYDIDSALDSNWWPVEVHGRWEGEYLFYKDGDNNFIRRKGNETEIIISGEIMRNLAVEEASISPDFKYVLLKYNVRKVFRHSTLGEYSIYTIETGSHTPLHGRPLQYAFWGREGSQITYVLDSDVYYKRNVDATPIAVTTSGAVSNGRIANGVTDWLYEEEMFSSTLAHWISHDGAYLAYVTFNDTEVPQVDIVLYTQPYTTIKKVNYPKVGFQNPTADVYIYNLKTNDSVKIQVPGSLAQKDPILNSVIWVSGNETLVTWSNRYQNVSVVTHCVAPSNFQAHDSKLQCRTVHEQQADGWIENIGRKPSVGPGKSFFRIEERKQGGNGNFHHIRHIDYSTEQPSKRFLTSGNWEVTKIVSYHKSSDSLYFISTKTSPLERHLYSVNISAPETTLVCHTCDQDCGYVDASMSSLSDWVLLDCLGPQVPYTSLFNGKDTIVLESNSELVNKVKNSKMPTILYEDITISGELGTYEFQAKLYVPPGQEAKQNIPVMLYVYGGPGSQMVSAQFKLDWLTYLVTEKEIAVVTFDGRGSGFRGSNAMKEVSRKLGVFEIEDQITAVREVLKRHSYLDENRVGVWGWSYGGYASMRIATHPNSLEDNLMKCVISVAPVTDWRLYDSIYTERYMGSPVDNYGHYEDSSVLSKSEYFKNFEFLLVHGTKDDNVHFQNTAGLEQLLVWHGVIHRYQVYTDEAHSLSSHGAYALKHLFRMMTQFLTDCYGLT